MNIVISQSMYFPWVGLLEQIHLADVFVHYNDVQFTKGFYNRVQVKTSRGTRWLTIPLKGHHRGQKINEVIIDNRQDWREKHLNILKQEYRHAPFSNEMLSIVESVFNNSTEVLSDVTEVSTVALAKYFDLDNKCRFLESTDIAPNTKSSQRLHNIVMELGGNVYITGHGAKNYLNHQMFLRSDIKVQYMQYVCLEYPQLHGPFTPYVTALDLIANCGKNGKKAFVSNAIDWKEFINGYC